MANHHHSLATLTSWSNRWLPTTSVAILPGTEDMAEYGDAMFHLRESWPFLFVMAIPSAVIALLTAGGQRHG